MSSREPALKSSRGPRAALLLRRGPAAAALALALLLTGLPARAQDPCAAPREQPGAGPSPRVLAERVRCLETHGRLEEAVPVLQRLAQAPEARVREHAYLQLYRLGQEVALPQVGEAGELAAAPGCARGLWADRYAWAEPGHAQGSAALLFATVPDVEVGAPGAGADAGLADEEAAEPVELGRPEEGVGEVGGALDLLVASAADPSAAALEEGVRGEDLQCTVVLADACSGRVGVVCEDRGGLPAPAEDQALPFPLPPERLQVKEFLLP